MPYPQFDRTKLVLRPLTERENDLDLSAMLPLDAETPDLDNADIRALAARIVAAKAKGAAVILSMGAHVIRAGVSRFIIDLMERGYITHVAMNGAGPIHDYEFALIGGTTESVARYIRTGEFGLWEETGRLNEAAKAAAAEGIGFGEAIGRMVTELSPPYLDVSILAAGYRLRVPVTVHIGIGYDIIHEHPNADGAALGAASYNDFLVYAKTIDNLESGVFLNFGSAVMGPEVYLKALSMVRNVARREGREVAHFATGVFDLIDLGPGYREQPPKSNPHYYYRPWKTILVRTVADGGESFYIAGDHRDTFPYLYRQVLATAR
ncbi:MAG: hypothetical protein FJX75_23065 [Armatimonadetes bacterium]|nr:hypothetical protein [Armatimonadota bacterium]